MEVFREMADDVTIVVETDVIMHKDAEISLGDDPHVPNDATTGVALDHQVIGVMPSKVLQKPS